MNRAALNASPLVAELDVLDPLVALDAVSHLPYPFLLQSVAHGNGSEWSFFGASPFQVFRGGSLDDLAVQWHSLASAAEPRERLAPFMGGAVGYWAYDLGRRFERVPAHARDDLRLPDYVLGFYDVVGAINHRENRAWWFASGPSGPGRLDMFRRLIDAHGAANEPLAQNAHGIDATSLRSTFSDERYLRAVEAVQDHIVAGDIFQANLSRRWTLDHGAGSAKAVAAPLYRALAQRSPAPFAAYVDAGDHAIVSSSPECFLEIRGDEIESRPIKGTRPRAPGARDREESAQLLNDPKDRAENVMIVDVVRNDFGRVCQTGSIRAKKLCELESHALVHHLVSTVKGRLRGGVDLFDVLRATFPGASITGAPKIRAMQILEELEPVRRHIYTGSIGYLDWTGDAGWNIAIRTALVTGSAVHFSAGGGIVADSVPEKELQETLDKAEGMRLAWQTMGVECDLSPRHAAAAKP